jgi:hypothetical protein
MNRPSLTTKAHRQAFSDLIRNRRDLLDLTRDQLAEAVYLRMPADAEPPSKDRLRNLERCPAHPLANVGLVDFALAELGLSWPDALLVLGVKQAAIDRFTTEGVAK